MFLSKICNVYYEDVFIPNKPCFDVFPLWFLHFEYFSSGYSTIFLFWKFSNIRILQISGLTATQPILQLTLVLIQNQRPCEPPHGWINVLPQADQARHLWSWLLIGACGELFEDRVPQKPTRFFFAFFAFYPLYSLYKL